MGAFVCDGVDDLVVDASRDLFGVVVLLEQSTELGCERGACPYLCLAPPPGVQV